SSSSASSSRSSSRLRPSYGSSPLTGSPLARASSLASESESEMSAGLSRGRSTRRRDSLAPSIDMRSRPPLMTSSPSRSLSSYGGSHSSRDSYRNPYLGGGGLARKVESSIQAKAQPQETKPSEKVESAARRVDELGRELAIESGKWGYPATERQREEAI